MVEGKIMGRRVIRRAGFHEQDNDKPKRNHSQTSQPLTFDIHILVTISIIDDGCIPGTCMTEGSTSIDVFEHEMILFDEHTSMFGTTTCLRSYAE